MDLFIPFTLLSEIGKCMIFKVKKLLSERNSSSEEDLESHVLPLKTYFAVFFVLLFFIFFNVGVSFLSLSRFWTYFIVISVSVFQTGLVALFFMELIHEEKFFSFIFLSTLLFMLLFLVVSLFELNYRDQFHVEEDIYALRQSPESSGFAPKGPKLPEPSAQSAPAHH
jgi:caa(3)-type oxidase subunit IV